jgi:hypothetical protein
MPRLKARRGAVVVLLAIMIIALVAVTALAMDFSRLWALRNELQTAADAGAHAGAVQLNPPNNAGLTVTVVQQYATMNPAMQGTVTVDSIELGQWDDVLKTFVPGAPVTDAVNVVVSRQATGLVMALVGVPMPRLKARAVGWANAPVAQAAGCIKPWAIPQTVLMYRLNLHRNILPPDSYANLTRPFDQIADIQALQNMTAAERTFQLKLSSSGQILDSVSTTMPGNYQAVVLPPFYDASTGDTIPKNQLPQGANPYRDDIAGATCMTLGVGDSLETQPGNMDGPTIQGLVGGNPANGPGVCADIVGETINQSLPTTDPAFGDCLDSSGNAGVDIKSAFYVCTVACNGRTSVEVTLLGSFTLTKAYPQKLNGVFDKAEIRGIFEPITDPGTVGAGSTTLITPIIAR